MTPVLCSSRPPRRALPLTLTLALGLAALAASAADWSQWRGPGRADHSPDTGLLKQWPSGGPRRVWLNRDVGLGYAGYAVVGDRLYTMGLRNDQEWLLALDAATGKELWAAVIGPAFSNDWGNGPRGTPTVEAGSIWALGGQGNLICAKADSGQVIWKKSLADDLNGKVPGWGYTESPLIVGDLVICTPGGDDGTLAALNKRTGAAVWRSKGLTDGAHYSSPILVQHAGKSQAVQLVEKKFFGVDTSNGEVLWQQEFPRGRVAVIPTPIARDGMVYVTAGYSAGCTMVQLGAGNEVTVVYDNKVMKNHHGGVILVGDYLYGHSDNPGSGWVCQNFKTGEQVWIYKDFGKGAIHYADGMFYCLAEDSGEVALIEASSEGWKEHGRFKLSPQTEQRRPKGRIWTHPVVVNGRLYLRDQELLFCYDVKG